MAQSAGSEAGGEFARDRARRFVRLDLAGKGCGANRADGSTKDDVCRAGLRRCIPRSHSSRRSCGSSAEWRFAELPGCESDAARSSAVRQAVSLLVLIQRLLQSCSVIGSDQLDASEIEG